MKLSRVNHVVVVLVRVLVGTCGFQKARSRHYRELDVVEVQQTFYDPPSPDTLRSWRREAPSGFVFTVKAWMLVTHEYNKRLWSRLRREVPGSPENYGLLRLNREVLWAWEVTLEAARALEARVVLLQTPPSFGPTEENVARVKRFLKEVDWGGFALAWEPRGDWWLKPGLLSEIAESTGVIIAGDVLRGRRPPASQRVLYARLHGLGGREVNYRYKYTDEDLERLAAEVKSLGKEENYVLFNNVYAFDDAVRFKRMTG